jgi:hypothetical protein
MREIVLLLGNCQSRKIGRLLDELPAFSDRFETVHFKNYGRPAHGDIASGPLQRFVRENKARIRLFIRQKTHGWFEDALGKDDFAPGTDVVDYPAALLNYIWPLSAHGAHRLDGNEFQKGRFPFSIMDAEVVRLKQEGVPEHKLLERYFEMDVVKKYRVDRLRSLNAYKAREVDKMSSFGTWDFIEDNVSQVQLFRTENHPDGPLLSRILRGIGEHTSAFPSQSEFDDLVDRVWSGPGIQRVEAPIHPQIIEHFGLEWARAKRFNFWGYTDLTFEEYLIRMFTLEADEEFFTARTLFAKGDVTGASEWIDKAVERLPDNEMYRALETRINRRLRAAA